MARSTTARLEREGSNLTVSQHETDAPILPVEQIARLQEICPERVSWVFDEASKEADFRRTESRRVNKFVFTERILGIVGGLIIGVFALVVAWSLAMNSHYVVASVVGGSTALGLVSSFVLRGIRQSSASRNDTPEETKRNRK